jgi:hypothetical protein
MERERRHQREHDDKRERVAYGRHERDGRDADCHGGADERPDEVCHGDRDSANGRADRNAESDGNPNADIKPISNKNPGRQWWWGRWRRRF